MIDGWHFNSNFLDSSEVCSFKTRKSQRLVLNWNSSWLNTWAHKCLFILNCHITIIFWNVLLDIIHKYTHGHMSSIGKVDPPFQKHMWAIHGNHELKVIEEIKSLSKLNENIIFPELFKVTADIIVYKNKLFSKWNNIMVKSSTLNQDLCMN